MEQLVGSDSIFLAMETETTYAHVGALVILDPSDAPGFSFEHVQDVVVERLRQVPRFAQRLRSVPFDLDRPFLVDDANFSVKNHAHRIAVPSPGSLRELCELAGHLYARHLDRSRPLWEMWFIEGLEGGKVAIFFKSHHCLIDGGSGAGLGEILYDIEPNPPPRAPADRVADARGRRAREEPSDAELMARGMWNAFTAPARITRYAGQLAQQFGTMLPYLQRGDVATSGPSVSFNAPIRAGRSLAVSKVPLEEVRALRKQLGVKINDIVLELTGSAVRRYLEARGELPEESLVVGIAISTRDKDDKSLGNQVATVFVPWPIQIDDPLERLFQIHEKVNGAKEMQKALGAREIQAIGDTAPPGLLNLAWRALTSSGLPAPGNLLVSNTPGPPIPLYMAGAPIVAFYPMSILAPQNGLNVTAVSYRGNIEFGFTVDPELVEDPWFIAEGIPLALDALKEAAAKS